MKAYMHYIALTSSSRLAPIWLLLTEPWNRKVKARIIDKGHGNEQKYINGYFLKNSARTYWVSVQISVSDNRKGLNMADLFAVRWQSG